MSATLTGGCACGAVRFAVDAPLGEAGYCHCTRCQRRTGTAASAQARVVPGSFRVTAGAERIGAWRPQPGFVKAFATCCGAQLFSHHPDDPDVLAVRLGAIDGDPGVRPSFRQRLDSAAVWEPVPDDGLAHYAGPKPGIADR